MGSWQILPSSSLYSPSSASVALLFVVLIALIWYHLSSTSMLFLLFPVALLKSLFNAFSSWRHSLIPRSRLFGVCSLRSPLWFPKSLFPYVKHNVGKCSIFLSTFLCYLTDHAGIVIEVTLHCFVFSFRPCYLITPSVCLFLQSCVGLPSLAKSLRSHG